MCPNPANSNTEIEFVEFIEFMWNGFFLKFGM
jgi:hypothetical protein